MALVKIRTSSGNFTVSAENGTTVSDILKSTCIPISFPCAGKHLCGKCRVFAYGNVTPPENREKELLQGNLKGMRLACFAKITGDCVIIVPDSYENAVVEMENNSLKAEADEKCAVVFDIGTTTVAASVYGLRPFRLLCSEGELNCQRPFGSDVMSRIDYCRTNGNRKLTESIVSQLSEMAETLCCKASAKKENILRFVITGNTTMLHIFAGLNPDTMSTAPFQPKTLFGSCERADKYFKGFTNAEIILPPCIGPFLGADLVCAVEASGMTEREESSFIADIGTNGEMALFYRGKLFCCSAAAGPAFEGAGIEMGMPACDGAAYKFFTEHGVIKCLTIGDKTPTGICGTGLISAAALMLKTGIMDYTGYIRPEGHPYTHQIGCDDDGTAFLMIDSIKITQRDIRLLQLAKGAVSAGIKTLLKECGINSDSISSFYLCGGFGSRIDPEEAAIIGLIPDSFKFSALSLGNAAAQGASSAAVDGDIEKLKQIASEAVEISLAENPYFAERYIEEMNFPLTPHL